MDSLELHPYGPSSESFITAHQTHPFRYHRPLIVQSGTDSITAKYGLFLSAGTAACITSSFYNPLDCLRVRWQTIPESLVKSSSINNWSSRGIIEFTTHIVKAEGFINGLWRPGVTANAIGMGSSAALRFGFYEHVRDTMQSTVTSDKEREEIEEDEKKGIFMFLAGLCCGGAAYFVTSPFHIMKTMMQAERNMIYSEKKISIGGSHLGSNKVSHQQHGIMTKFTTMIKERGILSLWKGSMPVAARGSLFTAGQMLGYDGFKTICKSNDLIDDGIALHVASSTVAALGATILSTPADFVMARYVSSTNGVSTPSTSLSQCIITIYKEKGIIGFWRGSGICFIRVFPVMLSYSTIYEKLRYCFGCGYLT